MKNIFKIIKYNKDLKNKDNDIRLAAYRYFNDKDHWNNTLKDKDENIQNKAKEWLDNK